MTLGALFPVAPLNGAIISGVDALAQNFAMGTGNGISTLFCAPSKPPISLPLQVYKNDWQGNQLQYATARTNQLSYSTIENVDWINNGLTGTPYFGVAPDGTFTTYMTTASSVTRYIAAAITGGVEQFYSVYVKPSVLTDSLTCYTDGSFLAGGAFGSAAVTFSGVTGSAVLSGIATAGGIINLGSGVYRMWVKFTPDVSTSAANCHIDPKTSNPTQWWGPMSEPTNGRLAPTSYIPTPANFTSRASTGTYFDVNGVMQTAAANVARYGYFYDTGSARWISGGLILEAAATNLMLSSKDFTQGVWIKQAGVSVTPNATTALDGTLTACRIDWSSTSVGQGIYQIGGVVSTTLPNTKSVYIKAAVAGGSIQIVDPNVTEGSTTLVLTTQWQEVSLSEVQAGGLAGLWVRKNADSPAYIYADGAQLENSASYPTSRLLTTSAAVTRAADASSSAAVTATDYRPVTTAAVTIPANGDGTAVILSWPALPNGTDGTPSEYSGYTTKSVQVTGTFGAGGSVSLEGSNDGVNWFVLTNPGATALTFTAAGMAVVVEATRYIKPVITAGDGTTALTVTVFARRPSAMHQ